MPQMKYGSVTFPYNPETLKIVRSREISERFSPLCGSIVQDYGVKAVRVTGEGIFLGENAAEYVSALKKAFELGGANTLVVEDEQFQACFSELTLEQNAAESGIRYSFCFVEVPQ